MNFKKIFTFLFIVLTTINTTSLKAIAKYKAIPLDYLAEKELRNKENTVSFEYHLFNSKDCNKYLGRSEILKKGYQPIQIKIVNNTNKSFELSLNSFSFPCADYLDVADSVSFNTAKRVIGWSIGAIFIFPLIIPAIIEGVESPRANDKLYADYAHKSLKNQVIKPFTTINGLVFVANSQFNNDFAFDLIDSKNNIYTLSTTRPFFKTNDKKLKLTVDDYDSEEDANYSLIPIH